MNTGNRALIAIRVSKIDKRTGSYSPALQRKQAERYAKDLGLTALLDVAEDLSVPAKIAPEKREGLGPWLTERFHEWDVLVVAMSDRVSRDLRHSVELDKWCEDNEKGLFIVDLDLRMDYRPDGDMKRTRRDRREFLARSSGAEDEYVKISERSLNVHEDNRTDNRVNGGTPPYGYQHVPHPDIDEETGKPKGKQYGIVPEQQLIINRAADLLLAGMSWHEIADTLNAEGLKPAGRKGMKSKGIWHGVALSRILKSPACMGRKMTSTVGLDERSRRAGKRRTAQVPVEDEHGMAVIVGPPLFTEEKWIKIQKEIAKRSVGRKERTKNSTPLLGVVICNGCGHRMYRSIATTGRGQGRYEYYKCSNRPDRKACKGYSWRAEALHKAVNIAARELLSHLPEVRREFIKGSDHTRDLERIRERIAKLNVDYYEKGTFTGTDEQFASIMSKLKEQEQTLAIHPYTPDEWDEIETGRSLAGVYFATDDLNERRRLLMQHGITVLCGPTAEERELMGTHQDIHMDIPQALRNRYMHSPKVDELV